MLSSFESEMFHIIVKKSTYFFWHIFVVHHRDELLHERWCSNLLVEWRTALVHDDIEKTKSEKDYLELICLEPSFDSLGH